jgi:ferredoxin
MTTPVIDQGRCNLCEGCIASCPEVFSLGENGRIEVADLEVYPRDCVDEAIKYCPRDCIVWEET